MKNRVMVFWGAARVKFEYVNWHGRRHEYVIDVKTIELQRDDGKLVWTLNGDTVTRDGRPRLDMGSRRRTFVLDEIKQLEVL
jgi:hypothetical protein